MTHNLLQTEGGAIEARFKHAKTFRLLSSTGYASSCVGYLPGSQSSGYLEHLQKWLLHSACGSPFLELREVHTIHDQLLSEVPIGAYSFQYRWNVVPREGRTSTNERTNYCSRVLWGREWMPSTVHGFWRSIGRAVGRDKEDTTHPDSTCSRQCGDLACSNYSTAVLRGFTSENNGENARIIVI